MGNHKVLKTAGINLRYSMYDFIDAVKKQNIIWDREHENFHNRELRDQAWQQIGLKLCHNFVQASNAEKQEIAKTLLKRWKNTRDSYLRVNRLRQNGEEVSRASYIYEKELSFLLDVKLEDEVNTLNDEPRKQKQIRVLKNSVKRQRRISKNETTESRSELEKDGFHLALDHLKETVDTSENPTEKGEYVCSGGTLADNDVNNFAVQTLTSDPDPDQAFFDSIKPYMQRMRSDQKLDFQIEVLKILRNFKSN